MLTAGALLLAGRQIRSQGAARPGLTPIQDSPGTSAAAPLPAGAILLRADDASGIEAPLLRQARTTADGSGNLLSLPEQGGADNNRGHADFPIAVQQPGRYAAWVRARWDNACGNSVMLSLDDGPKLMVGGDDVFGVWHWVRAGYHPLASGARTLRLAGREDGVAVDTILLVMDDEYVPPDRLLEVSGAGASRRVGDRFDRSPGHGLAPWSAVTGRWDIAFTLDPNRIPDQYALTGRPALDGTDALVLLQADPWSGVRFSFSFSPAAAGEAGAIIACRPDGADGMKVLLAVSSNAASVRIEGTGDPASADLGDRVRPGQWHRVAIESWAWLVRIAIDGETVLTHARSAPAEGHLGFVVRSGSAVFDDAFVEELRWQAEDGADARLPWRVDATSRWCRVDAQHGGGLAGRRGALRAESDGGTLHAVLLDAPVGVACLADGRPLSETGRHGELRVLAVPAGDVPVTGAVAFVALADSAQIRRVALTYGPPEPERYVEGPYHFTSVLMEDPGDYLDFTEAEQQQTTTPGQAGLLRRQMKTFPLVGRRAAGSAWASETRRWAVDDGALTGLAPASVQHWRDLNVDLEWSGRIRLTGGSDEAAIALYAGDAAVPPVRVVLSPAPRAAAPDAALALRVPADGAWHGVRLSVKGGQLSGAIDDEAPAAAAIRRGIGGAIQLEAASGRVQFDDITFTAPREAPGAWLYAFDRRETDWWREGGPWVDHGGISCALASHWISLLAPAGKGVLWNKRAFGPDLLVSLTVEENGEWFGWDQKPSHLHHAYDNICLILAEEPAWDAGYRLEVNARDRTATVLYRKGQPVASVPQDAAFPIRYVGGHQPYAPRRSRVAIARAGSRLRVLINGVEVLAYDDPEPLPVSRVGVGGYATRLNFSRIEIRELPVP